MNEQPQSHGRKSVLNLYAALGASLILSVLPSVTAAGLSLVFFLGVLIAAYHMRGKVEEHSLIENHATFIIRTLWIGAFLTLPTMGLATAYMMSGIDYAPFEVCAQALANKGVAWMESAGMMEVYGLVEPCVEGFITENKVLFINAVVIAGAPVVIYMTYRLIKGLSRASKGYRLAKPKGWF
ncbi:MAG TPA: hypothetical protein PK513_00175 [Alphaproteobacteria bacterium]|nr:MAG: hypothetical protein H6859_06650 [Rhodospirillales bacterium]HOO80903.1 hypothetical protein [Alphaproteobacteria bacterium]